MLWNGAGFITERQHRLFRPRRFTESPVQRPCLFTSEREPRQWKVIRWLLLQWTWINNSPINAHFMWSHVAAYWSFPLDYGGRKLLGQIQAMPPTRQQQFMIKTEMQLAFFLKKILASTVTLGVQEETLLPRSGWSREQRLFQGVFQGPRKSLAEMRYSPMLLRFPAPRIASSWCLVSQASLQGLHKLFLLSPLSLSHMLSIFW